MSDRSNINNSNPRVPPRKSSSGQRTVRPTRETVVKHSNTNPRTPSSSNRRSKGIFITSEVQVGPASPPPVVECVLEQPHRATTFAVDGHKDALRMSAPPIRPSSSGNTLITVASDGEEQKLTSNSAPGTYFLEDPRWRKSFDALRPKSLGKENLVSAPARTPSYEARLMKRPQTSDAVRNSHASDLPAIEDTINAASTSASPQCQKEKAISETSSEATKHPLCRTPSTRVLGLARSAQKLRHDIELKIGLRKTTSGRRGSQNEVAPAPVIKPRRTALPHHMKILSDFHIRSKKRVEEFETDVLALENAKQSQDNNSIHADIVGAYPGTRPRSQSFEKLIHDPATIKRFSTDWADLLASRMNEIDGAGVLVGAEERAEKEHGGLSSETKDTSLQKYTNLVKEASTNAIPIDYDQTRPLSQHQMEGTHNNQSGGEPVPSITLSTVQPAKSPTPPRPAPGTSSKVGARLDSMIVPGRIVNHFHGAYPSASEHTSEKIVSNANLEKKSVAPTLSPDTPHIQRSLSDASPKTMIGPSPSKSVDTLSKIEAQIQPSGPALTDTNQGSSRLSTYLTPLERGPSGEPPERPLPELPANHQQILAEDTSSRTSSRSRRSSRQKRSSNHHQRQAASVCSTSTMVRTISPSMDPPRSHSVSPKKGSYQDMKTSRNVSNLRLDLSTRSTFNSHNQGTSVDLRSPTSVYSQDSTFSTHSLQYRTATVIQTARVERVNAIRTRDLAKAHTFYNGIVEEDEDQAANNEESMTGKYEDAVTNPDPDPIDQFPAVPSSRPGSRTQHHKSSHNRTTSNRSISRSRRPTSVIKPLQPLSQSGIMIVAHTDPSSSQQSSGTTNPRANASARRQSSMYEPNQKLSHGRNPEQSQTKDKVMKLKPSKQSIRSHISLPPSASTTPTTSVHPIVPATAQSHVPHTPPSSSNSTSSRTSKNSRSLTSEDMEPLLPVALPVASDVDVNTILTRRIDAITTHLATLTAQQRRQTRQMEGFMRMYKRQLLLSVGTSNVGGTQARSRRAEEGVGRSRRRDRNRDRNTETVDTETELELEFGRDEELPALAPFDIEYETTSIAGRKERNGGSASRGGDRKSTRLSGIVSTRQMDWMLGLMEARP